MTLYSDLLALADQLTKEATDHNCELSAIAATGINTIVSMSTNNSQLTTPRPAPKGIRPAAPVSGVGIERQ